MRTSQWIVLALASVTASCASVRGAVARPAAAVPVAADSSALPVPYVAQSELLCGGAAIAMVERWWGRRGVYAEQFAHLVRKVEGGIRTTDMAEATRARGWDVVAQRATAAEVRQSVRNRVPVIALIQVARDRYHYVVIVDWTAAGVTYHDPAVAPSVHADSATFMQRWSGAESWAMIVRPTATVAATSTSSTAPAVTVVTDSLPCRPFLDRAADAVAADAIANADSILASAARACPTEPVVLRELAGVRFRQGRRAESAQLAEQYLQRMPGDSLGWQLLASARYLSGDPRGALAAWNVVGRPRVDLVRIEGSRRIRFRTLAEAANIAPGAVLTPTRLGLAQRRLADTPALAAARVSYQPVTGGVVEVRADVVERPLTRPIRELLAVEATRAAFARQVNVALSTPLGLGELFTAHWRWRRADPRVVLRLDLPARIIIPAELSFEGSWATFRFGDDIGVDTRRASSVSVTSWLRPGLEARTAVRFEHWNADRDFVTTSLGVGLHAADDRISLLADAEHAVPTTGNASYDRVSARAAWTLPADRWSTVWSVRAGADFTTRSAPLGLWPLAAGGLLRSIPLRAHPLIVDDVLPASRAGRRIVHGGVAADRPVTTFRSVAVGVGIFLDAAHVALPGDFSGTERLYLDAGAGVRVGLPGPGARAVRIDLARGVVADQRWGVTAAFVQPLPLRLSRVR
ncbi:MAG: papain-like cysteine protease family protein [Gemmatimonadota bacterium]